MMKLKHWLGALAIVLILTGCGDGDDTAPRTAESPEDNTEVDTAPNVPEATMVDGVQTLTVQVYDTGYSPSSFALKADVPARITFDQHGTTECAWSVKSEGLGLELTDLPEGEKTVVEFTPPANGTFVFTCGMDMLKGSVIVNES